MDKREIVEKVRKYSELVCTHFPVKLIILYGSHAKETAREDSDIDVAVVVDKIDEDFLASEVKLYKLRRVVDERIEPILLEEGDDKSGFLEEILREATRWGQIFNLDTQIQIISIYLNPRTKQLLFFIHLSQRLL